MAEDFPEILEGPLDTLGEDFYAIANGAIPQWSPVVIVAPATGETFPRVGTTTVAEDRAKAGMKIGPNKTLVAGDICLIRKKGRAKCKVNGAVSRGDSLATSTSAGKAKKLAHTAWPGTYASATAETIQDENAAVLAKVLTNTGAADGDIVAVEVNPSSLDT
ncbi:MAG: hypothetical protein HYY67_01760 [Thaumarchaeota archaeon]|nr:hypothetical protein [Nitrososphaerota archaeon]MCS4537572.1 hypothetical protein [Nitrososphaerota archaeon]